jgi:prevent-host-death family protein
MSTITIGAYEAKTKLASLLARVSRGGEVIITKHEKPVARLTAFAPGPRVSVTDALDGLAAIRGRARRGRESLKELIAAGRRI